MIGAISENFSVAAGGFERIDSMKKTYVTTMPDHVGAFLKASRCIAALGINITRVSYNKAVDMHTLFIEAEGTSEQLDQASQRLKEIGYLQSNRSAGTVMLLEFKLQDIPGSVTAVLELIQQFQFNISYISSQEEGGSGYQHFKMGLLVEDPEQISVFVQEASKLCSVRVIHYDKIQRTYDNSIFYISFANELAAQMELSEEDRGELVIQSNLVMQLLDEHGGSPYKTFEVIGKFGEALARYRGYVFAPRITRHRMDGSTTILLLEPPCGSNTTILCNSGRYLFVDTGYACYRQEMLDYFHALLPDFDTCDKAALVTHADVDHCGLLDLFPVVFLSQKSRDSLVMESTAGGGFREENPLHAPYARICKTLTSYCPPDPKRLQVIAGTSEPLTQPLERTGDFLFGSLSFEVYEGAGGHLPGEIVLVERRLHLAFTGDIYVNIKEFTREQTVYNRYAPYLMTSVDTDPKLAAREREALWEVLGEGTWTIFGGHGLNKELTL